MTIQNLLIAFVILAVVIPRTQAVAQQSSRYDGPIIDVHLHAPDEIWVPRRPCKPKPCEDTPTLATSADELKPMTLAAMARNNIVLGIVSDHPENVFAWTEGEDRFLNGISVQSLDDVSVQGLRHLFASGRAQILGELTAQYAGIPVDDEALDPLFALAHEFDVPVHVHILGGGGAGAPSCFGSREPPSAAIPPLAEALAADRAVRP